MRAWSPASLGGGGVQELDANTFVGMAHNTAQHSSNGHMGADVRSWPHLDVCPRHGDVEDTTGEALAIPCDENGAFAPFAR